jgi:hypothetical protein
MRGRITPDRMSNVLVGNAGEYYVCAELCIRGNTALLTPQNNPLFDIVATTPEGDKSVHIQVKTRSVENKQGWKPGKDITRKGTTQIDLWYLLTR